MKFISEEKQRMPPAEQSAHPETADEALSLIRTLRLIVHHA